MEDSRPIFFCKRFSYNENALYQVPFSRFYLVFNVMQEGSHLGSRPLPVLRHASWCLAVRRRGGYNVGERQRQTASATVAARHSGQTLQSAPLSI